MIHALAFAAISLDGRLTGPDEDLSFLERYVDPLDDMGFSAVLQRADALVMGRRTWDAIHRFEPWPYGALPLRVRTSRPLPSPHGERPVSGSIAAILSALAEEGAQTVYVDGGETVRDALREGVLDELVLTLVPEVLGAGVPLFAEGLPPSTWRLAGLRTRADGLLQGRWLRADARPVTAG
ncbi:MAG: dihydrofolate reductase [Deltaproteobacteria bacterium]|nr:dihydrofolate reductase [Deltaproteobacteria bacterium]